MVRACINKKTIKGNFPDKTTVAQIGSCCHSSTSRPVRIPRIVQDSSRIERTSGDTWSDELAILCESRHQERSLVRLVLPNSRIDATIAMWRMIEHAWVSYASDRAFELRAAHHLLVEHGGSKVAAITFFSSSIFSMLMFLHEHDKTCLRTAQHKFSSQKASAEPGWLIICTITSAFVYS